MMNHYETVFILTPVLSDIQMKETVKKFTGLLKDNGATIVNSEEWGLKKLAYPIDGKSTGFYVLLQFDVEPSFISIFETEFRRDERVIRFLTTRLDKYALAYAEKRMKNRANKLNEIKENKRRSREHADTLSNEKEPATVITETPTAMPIPNEVPAEKNEVNEEITPNVETKEIINNEENL